MTQVFTGITSHLLKRLTNVKIIFTMHDAGTHNERGQIVKNILLRLDTSSADAVIFISDYVKNTTYKRLFSGIPSAVAPFGRLNENTIMVQRQANEVPNLLFFGRIERYKGLEIFVDALIRLAELDISFQFVIAGSGSIEPKVKRKLNSLERVRDGKVINRWISDEELHSLHTEADILVVPYTEASQSGVLATAQEYFLPFVCSNVGALPEQAKGKGGLISRDLTPDALANEITKLFSRPAYDAKVAEIKNFQEQLSWVPTSRAVSQICAKLVK